MTYIKAIIIEVADRKGVSQYSRECDDATGFIGGSIVRPPDLLPG